MKNQVLKCQDCQQEFIWTVDEQQWYKKNNFPPPLRCPICQAAYNAAKKDRFRGKISQ